MSTIVNVRIKAKLCRHACFYTSGNVRWMPSCCWWAGLKSLRVREERGEDGSRKSGEGVAKGAGAANYIGPKFNDNKRNNQRNNNNNKTTATLWRAIIFSSSPCLSWLAITCTASLALRSDLSMLCVFSLESTSLFAQHLARWQSPEVLVVELRHALGSTLDCLTDETSGLLLPGDVLLAT